MLIRSTKTGTMERVRPCRKRAISADFERQNSEGSVTLVAVLEKPCGDGDEEDDTFVACNHRLRATLSEMDSSVSSFDLNRRVHRRPSVDDEDASKRRRRRRRTGSRRSTESESATPTAGSSWSWLRLAVISSVMCAVFCSCALLFWSANNAARDNHEVWLKSVASDVFAHYSRKNAGPERAFSLWPYYLHDMDCCTEPAPAREEEKYQGESQEDSRHNLWESDPSVAVPRYRTSLQQAAYFEDAEEGRRPRPERAAEASASLRAAVDMSQTGKMTKAMRLFQHALALVDDDPEILIAYGEFLEKYENNFVEADSMYARALALSPRNSRAVANKERTSPLVAELDFEVLLRIDSKRDELAKLPDSNAALRRIKKEAYFQYVYHTVGIEGNTMTLSQTRSVLETRIAIGGKSVMEHNEILGMDAALRFINQSLLHRIGMITVDDILAIHRKVMGVVDPDIAGVYRKSQVFVSKHIPPPADRVPALMEDLVAWLNSPSALEAHPMNYAALAHYKLVYIHPFVDGNGRTARLFMNWILMQEGYPPVIIRKQDRHRYYETLQKTNDGDVRPFLRFIADCAEKTLDVYLWATSEVPERAIQALPKPEKTLQEDFEEDEVHDAG